MMDQATLRRKPTSLLPLLAAGGVGLAGFLLVWLNTPQGVDAGSDAYFYLTAATNLLHGLGLGRLAPNGQLIPLTHYPPLYSLAVAGLGWLLQGDVLAAARWIAALTFGANSFLFCVLGFRFTGSLGAGLGAALLALFSPIFLQVDVAALSEGLFLALLLLALWLIATSLKALDWPHIIGAALLVAGAAMTRYAGNALILVGGLAILFLNGNPWRRKIAAAFVFCLASGLPLTLWYARNWLLTGSATNRIFELHWPLRSDYTQALTTLTSWILPGPLSLRLRLALLLLGMAIIAGLFMLWLARSGFNVRKPAWPSEPALRFTLVLFLFIVTYSASLWVSRSFFDASTHWDTRIFSPLYSTGALFFLVSAWNGARLKSSFGRRFAFFAAEALLLALYLPQSGAFLSQAQANAASFTGPVWRSSPTMQALSGLPAGGVVYSNNATAIYFVLDRVTSGIPEVYDSVKNAARPDYPANLAAMRAQLAQPASALVIFDPYGSYREYPPLGDLTLGLCVLQKTMDGTIYTACQ